MANNRHVHHIYYMIHALPFGDPCSETMSVHARLVKIKPLFPHEQIWLAHVVYTCGIKHTRSSRGASKQQALATVLTKGEHFMT